MDGIEYTADVLLAMQLTLLSENENASREEIRQAKKEIPKRVQVICLKNRNGKSNFSINYTFDPRYNYFEELAREKQRDL